MGLTTTVPDQKSLAKKAGTAPNGNVKRDIIGGLETDWDAPCRAKMQKIPWCTSAILACSFHSFAFPLFPLPVYYTPALICSTLGAHERAKTKHAGARAPISLYLFRSLILLQGSVLINAHRRCPASDTPTAQELQGPRHAHRYYNLASPSLALCGSAFLHRWSAGSPPTTRTFSQ
jgi:hypothetical protein